MPDYYHPVMSSENDKYNQQTKASVWVYYFIFVITIIIGMTSIKYRK